MKGPAIINDQCLGEEGQDIGPQGFAGRRIVGLDEVRLEYRGKLLLLFDPLGHMGQQELRLFG